MKPFLLMAVAAIFSSVSMAHGNIQTLDKVDAAKFVGTWYRIAGNPVIFEPGCSCAPQVLTPNSDGTVAVYNSCNSAKTGKLIEIRGTAEAADSSESKFSIDFGLPWKGQYWVVAVDSEYRYAAVTDSFGYSLCILSRTPELSADLYS